ncbi:hypothetical protein C2U70_15930 [Bradyrhizobium guangdongense]|nr:hypothetical protein C2U70_15930 [Bradyrhizobium guangdongense]
MEFAVAKFRSLLRGRTKTEPVVANAFVAAIPEAIDDTPPPAPASTDTVETALAVTDPVMTDAVATDQSGPDRAESRAIETEAEIVEVEVFEPAAIEQAPDMTEIVETVAGRTEAIETGITLVSSGESEVVAVAHEAIETKFLQATPVEADTSALPTVEPETVATQPAEADIVAFAVVAAEVVEPVNDVATQVAQPSGLSEREELIRRRWKETGVRMWNARTHGAGQAVLCIQGSVKLLPPKPGETMPQYDRLEFQLVDGRIVCEGFELDAPEAPRQRVFASAAG